jgi:hypothetical protein
MPLSLATPVMVPGTNRRAAGTMRRLAIIVSRSCDRGLAAFGRHGPRIAEPCDQALRDGIVDRQRLVARSNCIMTVSPSEPMTSPFHRRHPRPRWGRERLGVYRRRSELGGLPQQEFPLKPRRLCEPIASSVVLERCQRRGEQGRIARLRPRRPCDQQGGHALAELRQAGRMRDTYST